MIKFVLGFIALVLIGLTLYTYTDTEHKQPNKNAVHKTVQAKAPAKAEVPVAEPKVTVKQTKPAVKKTETQKSAEVASVPNETQDTSSSPEEIGKGLTLEGIENADVSDEEKERMIDDLAFYQMNNVDIEADFEKRKRIGQELSLREIMSANVSDDERERMIDDLAYFQTNHIDMNVETNLMQKNIK